jgi:hypothetical protein
MSTAIKHIFQKIKGGALNGDDKIAACAVQRPTWVLCCDKTAFGNREYILSS